MLIGQGAIDACKMGVTIAIRYACARPQFGGLFIMGYITHQRRLLPALATSYGLHLAMLRLKVDALGFCTAAVLGQHHGLNIVKQHMHECPWVTSPTSAACCPLWPPATACFSRCSASR